MITLSILGVFIGFISAFFGVGGGMILTPLLLLLGFDIKTAIGISIVQMVFSSIFGSYLNFKKGLLVVKEGIFIGLGGFLGGFGGGYLTQYLSDTLLQYLLLFLLCLAFYRISYAPIVKDTPTIKPISNQIFFSLGVLIGLFSISLGVGGAIILTPILVSVLHYPLKKAVSASLFFVLFSSVSGFLSRLNNGTIDLDNGLIVGIASLFGVVFGIFLKGHISEVYHKRTLLLLYLLIIMILAQKIIVSMLN